MVLNFRHALKIGRLLHQDLPWGTQKKQKITVNLRNTNKDIAKEVAAIDNQLQIMKWILFDLLNIFDSFDILSIQDKELIPLFI